MPINRRHFLKTGTLMAAALTQRRLTGFPVIKSTLNLGLIGVGLRGISHLRNLVQRRDVKIPAVCDIDPERIVIAQDVL
jgi:hypothetical protein